MSKTLITDGARKFWTKGLATIGVGAAIALAWWMKVEEARAPARIAVAAFNEPIDLGRAVFTPTALTLTRDNEPQSQQQLTLKGRLENMTGETVPPYFLTQQKPPLIEGEGLPREIVQNITGFTLVLERDQAPLQQLQPRINESVSMIWDVPLEWKSSAVSITFFKQKFKLRDNLQGRANWLGFEPVAKLSAVPEGG